MSEKFYEILITPGEINFAPENELTEIFQNVITICTTLKGTRPLNRDFGISSAIIDQPTPTEQAKFTAEIVSALRKYEPRVEITKITWENYNEKVRPRIRMKIKS